MKRRLVVLGGVVTLLVVWMGVDGLNPFNDAAFERSGWRRDVSSRLPMAADVIKLAARPEMTRDKITQLLGPPDSEYVGQAVDIGGNALRGARSLVYCLGSKNLPSSMDDAFVYIHLNDDGSVINAEIAGY